MSKGNLEWKFIPAHPEDQGVGFNDAGMEHFSSDRQGSLFRECIQNSLDAFDRDIEKAVVVEITLEEIPTDEVGGQTLKEALELCAESKYNKDEGREQFKEAAEMLGEKTIQTLFITDSNTTGASDEGDSEKVVTSWEGMTNSSGHSVKQDGGSLGSFGIGKSAPFASTPLRTVLYSTCYESKSGDLKKRFRGRSILVTHKQGEKTFHPRGNLGNELQSLCDEEVPARFDLAKVGTRISIPGYFLDSDDGGGGIKLE